MVPHPGNRRITSLILLILIFTASTTAQAKTDFKPPTLTEWLGSGETTGIFASGEVSYNITSGEQPRPTIPQIRLHSNTSQPINLGISIADFRLARVEANGSLTQTDYAHHTLSSIDAKNGVFWASNIIDYPSTYRLGVVIWNSSDGSIVGRLIATIKTTAEPLVKLTTDKAEYTRYDTINFTMINRGPQVMTSSFCYVYRQVDEGWILVNNFGTEGFPFLKIVLSKEKTYRGNVSSSYADLSQPGLYKIVKRYAPSVLGESGEASTEFRVNSTGFIFPISSYSLIGVYSVLVGALLGGVSGLVLFCLIRMLQSYPSAGDDASEKLLYVKGENRRKLAVILTGLMLIYLFLGPSLIFPTIFLGRGVAKERDFELVFDPRVIDYYGLKTVKFSLTATNMGYDPDRLERGVYGVIVNVYGLDSRLVTRFPNGLGAKILPLYSTEVYPGGRFAVDLHGEVYWILLPGAYWVTAQLDFYKSVETTRVMMIILP